MRYRLSPSDLPRLHLRYGIRPDFKTFSERDISKNKNNNKITRNPHKVSLMIQGRVCLGTPQQKRHLQTSTRTSLSDTFELPRVILTPGVSQRLRVRSRMNRRSLNSFKWYILKYDRKPRSIRLELTQRELHRRKGLNSYHQTECCSQEVHQILLGS